ncbi:hypothetical protein ACFQ69_32860 [Streptomyces sp. NPDC056470]|uniref:hypothetical protein n=1 Tax=Streptomyces sp. NPDC056470 TaxID=3345831 RepID=UPI0036C346F8
MTIARYAPPPGPARLARIRTLPWVDRSSPAGPCCRLLLVHDPLRHGEALREVEHDMRGLATGLGLGLLQDGRRYLGTVVHVASGYTLLDYGHAQHVLQVPYPSDEWYGLARATTHVHITLGLDPRPDDNGTNAHLYTQVAAQTGRLWAGVASVRS